MIILGGLGALWAAAVYLFASPKHVDELYLALLGQLFKICLPVAVRSTVSKVADKSEVGAIFSLFAFVQSLNFLLIPLVNVIYVATIEWYGGFVYTLVCGLDAGIIVLGTVVFAMVWRMGNDRVWGGRLASHLVDCFDCFCVL